MYCTDLHIALFLLITCICRFSGYGGCKDVIYLESGVGKSHLRYDGVMETIFPQFALHACKHLSEGV